LNYKIENADILKDNILASSEIKFKKLFANFPWLLRLRKQDIDSLDTSYWNKYNNIFSTRITSDWIFSTALVNMLEEEGKAISLVVNGSLYKLTDSEVREKFIKNGSIEAVIQLPENIFPFTSISSSLIVFSHRNNQIKFIDASGMCQKGRRINILNTEEIYKAYKEEKPEFLVKVSNDEIINNESILLVSNYLGLDKIKLINPTPLQDVVQKIFRGYQITAKKLDKYIVSKKIESYNYEVLQLNDIQDGIISSNLIKISVEDSKLNKYLLKDGDVVISAKSTKVKSAVVSLEPNRKVIATGSIIVIRPSEKLNSAYLKVFLDSYEGKILLDSIQTGSVIVSINPSRLMQMEVPLLSMNKQEKLGNKYLAKLDLIKITKNKLKSLEDEIEHIYDSESLGD
jgi:type I restriction enzyme M protein